MTRGDDAGSERRGPAAAAVSAGAEETQITDPFGASLPAGAMAIPDSGDAPYGTARLVGRYQVLERVGQGAMATVYKAYDPSIGRTLALKFLHASLCADGDYRERFLREARAAGALSHPNIVTVFDVGEVEGRPYIAMEFLEGTSLASVAPAGRQLPVADVAEIGIQLARALEYAHARGIVHRDIKPGNIICLEGARTQIKVADFGIAYVETRDSANETRAGTLLGTPHYMSPEQALGRKADARSDLFSAGVVLYQLLAGQTPFQGDNLVALAFKIAKEEPPSLEKLRPDVPPALRRVVERCLRKQPEKRFQNGGELVEALKKVAREIAEREQEQGRSRVLPLRVKWTLLMAAVVALTMGLTAAVVTDRQHDALRDGVIDYGNSLAGFMATQNAVSALSDEWDAVEVVVQELMKSGDFHDLTFVDREGTVRASSDPKLVGQRYAPPAGTQVRTSEGALATETSDATTGATVFAFEAPITFQGKSIGRVHLGLPGTALARVTRLGLTLMALLVVVTVAAVVVATWLIANRYSRPIALAAESMGEIARGRYDYRIAEERRDEFGQLYKAFDAMAAALQERGEAAQARAEEPRA